jgi:hypothetical protein
MQQIKYLGGIGYPIDFRLIQIIQNRSFIFQPAIFLCVRLASRYWYPLKRVTKQIYI